MVVLKIRQSLSLTQLRNNFIRIKHTFHARCVVTTSKVGILDSPDEYYHQILDGIRNAKHSIILSALYIGSNTLEKRMVAELASALRSNRNLKCTIVLDHSRARRGGTMSSLSTLRSLLEVSDFQPRLKLLLYRMPHSYSVWSRMLSMHWFLKLFPRVENLHSQLAEILGVYHCKFNVFDDTVILTGANLSEEYFVNRQDRYVCIERSSNYAIFPGDNSNISLFLKQFVDIIEPYCCVVNCHPDSIITNSNQLKSYRETANNSKLSLIFIQEPTCYSDALFGLFTKDKYKTILKANLTNLTSTHSDNKCIIFTPTPFKKSKEHVSSKCDDSFSSSCGEESYEKLKLTKTSSTNHYVNLIPLIQHNTIDICDESNYLPHVIHPDHYSIIGAATTDRNKHLSTSYRSLSHGFSESFNPWRKVIVSSPYPSFMPSFLESLLSIEYFSNTNLIENENTSSLANKSGSSRTLRNTDEHVSTNSVASVNLHQLINTRDICHQSSQNSLLSTAKTSLSIIVPHKHCHGFHNGRGLKSWIPLMHQWSLQQFLKHYLF